MKLKDSIILIVVFIIAIVLGAFIGMKVTERKTGNNETTEISIKEVAKIMERYTIGTCGKAYRTELNNIGMATLAIKNAPSTKITCESLKKDGLDTYVYMNTKGILYKQCLMINSTYLYKYDAVLNSYKNLFGFSKTLDKGHLEVIVIYLR